LLHDKKLFKLLSWPAVKPPEKILTAFKCQALKKLIKDLQIQFAMSSRRKNEKPEPCALRPGLTAVWAFVAVSAPMTMSIKERKFAENVKLIIERSYPN
jgi:hypothetical protein